MEKVCKTKLDNAHLQVKQLQDKIILYEHMNEDFNAFKKRLQFESNKIKTATTGVENKNRNLAK